MWLYFNSNGQLTTILEHGSPARAGSTNFEIFAAFEGLNSTNLSDYMATIKLYKPDLVGSSYPALIMSNASAEFEAMEGETNTGDFQGGTYYGFVFKFNELVDDNGTVDTSDDTSIVLLDTQGLWNAVITVIKDSYNVQGVATFNVAGTGTEQPSSINYDVITNQLVQNINRRALKSQTIINIENTSADISNYENGQMFYSLEDRTLYRKEDDELVPQVDSSFTVDGSLSATSRNPVENRIVTQNLQNIREFAAGKCASYTLDCSWTIQTLKDLDEHYDDVINVAGSNIKQAVDHGSYDSAVIANTDFRTNGDPNPRDSDYIIIRNNKGQYILDQNQTMCESLFQMGDIIWITQTNVPDRWYSNYGYYPLETTTKLYKHTITVNDQDWENIYLIITSNDGTQFDSTSFNLQTLIENSVSAYIYMPILYRSPIVSCVLDGGGHTLTLNYFNGSGTFISLDFDDTYDFYDTVSPL